MERPVIYFDRTGQKTPISPCRHHEKELWIWEFLTLLLLQLMEIPVLRP